MSECTSQDFYEDIDWLFVSGSEDEMLAEKNIHRKKKIWLQRNQNYQVIFLFG